MLQRGILIGITVALHLSGLAVAVYEVGWICLVYTFGLAIIASGAATVYYICKELDRITREIEKIKKTNPKGAHPIVEKLQKWICKF